MDLLLKEESSVLQRERVDHFKAAEDSVIRYVESCLNSTEPGLLFWNSGSKINNLSATLSEYAGLVDLKQVNGLKRINKHFETINQSMDFGSYFVAAVEAKETRKVRIFNKYPKGIREIVYTCDFLLHRCFAKLNTTKQLYFSLTKGKNRALSLTECLGRLVSCGFEVIDYKKIGYKTYVVTRKVSEPVYDMQPTYGLLCKLNRVGKNGKKINVYKLRTMHPYSEYLQEFICDMNDLEDGGKIKNDFRVTNWGKIFRKFWIDEWPMLINWFKRDMKLVGVRPLSDHYFSLYPQDVQELRVKVKPGLIPPFYADLPKTFDEIVESERAYLFSYLQKPIRTDIRYFFKALYNIIVKNARSN